jgi:hypothetical protein
MKQSQIWEILDIHRLLCDTDKHKNSIGLSLLYEFIAEHCLAGVRDDECECVEEGTAE